MDVIRFTKIAHERCLLLGDSAPHLYSLLPLFLLLDAAGMEEFVLVNALLGTFIFGYRPSMLMTSPLLTIPLGCIFVKGIVMAGLY